MSRLDLTLAREFEAALAWWQAAGVDCDFADDATALLAQAPLAASPDAAHPAAATGKPSPTAPQQQPGETNPQRVPHLAPASATPAPERRNWLGDSPPGDLAAFTQWWMETPGLDTARGFPRIAPRGPAGAALMVLVPQPEEEDTAQLLSGPQGRLLANILAAMGMDESAVYIAAALPCHTPLADLARLAAEGMDAVTLHHIALVAPARLLVLGTGLAPMIGQISEQPLREINQTAGKAPVMVSETLDALMDMPRLKARFWRRWMEWSATV